MKISKLFHWLYASLMFLPFIFLLPTLAYFGFNKYATAQESDSEITIDTETTTALNYDNASVKPLSNSDIELDKMYLWDTRQTGSPSFGGACLLSYVNVIDYSSGVNVTDYINAKKISTLANAWTIYDGTKSYGFNINNDYVVALVMISSNPTSWNNYYTGLNVPSFNVNQSSTSETITTTTETTYTMDISSSIEHAWNVVWNLPLFSWTHNSFVAQPFTYITGLFGMASDNPFNYVITYFVSISVCWLVFDFLMYVPNLAHRWLDKGALD